MKLSPFRFTLPEEQVALYPPHRTFKNEDGTVERVYNRDQSRMMVIHRKRQVIDMCHEAVLEIKSLLAEMKTRREYVAEAYLAGKAEAGNMISLPEWRDKAPPKASWDTK